VAAVVNALFGDQTGLLWNKINGVDAKIAATRTGVEKAIQDQGNLYKRLLDDFINGLGNASNFVIGALMGEFNNDASIWQVLLDSAIGMIPIAGEIGDVRDLIAYTKKFIDNPSEMQNAWNWVGVVGSLVGLVPVAGGAIKGVTKVARNADFLTEMKKLGPTIVDAVVDFTKRTDWNSLAAKSKNFYLNILDNVEGLLRKLNDGIRSFDNLLPKLGILQPEYAGIGKLPDEGFFADLADNIYQLRREAPKKIDEGFTFLKRKLYDLGLGLDEDIRKALKAGAPENARWSTKNTSDIPDIPQTVKLTKIDGAPPVEANKQGKHLQGHPYQVHSKTIFQPGIDHVYETQNAWIKGSDVPGQPGAKSYDTGKVIGQNGETWIKVQSSSNGIHGYPISR